MSATLLSRPRPRPALQLLGQLSLPLARTHEICGPARHTLAMLIAAAAHGPIFWVAPAWHSDTLNPDGMRPLLQPQRFTFLTPTRAGDVLWTLEEVLRSGAVPLVVGDIPAPPSLTAVRRLHLAAETGAAEGPGAPLCLLLTPGEGGAPGIETRWHMAPAHTPQARAWHLERRRARTAPPGFWTLRKKRGKITLSTSDPRNPP